MRLFDIISEIRVLMWNIFENVDEETGEIACTEDIADELSKLNITLEEKLESVALYMKERQAEADAIKAEAKKLTERARIAQNAADRIRDYLAYGMSEAGVNKVETARIKMSFRKSSAVIVDDLEAIPEQFLKIEKTANKAELKKALKECAIAGAHIEDRESLVIK